MAYNLHRRLIIEINNKGVIMKRYVICLSVFIIFLIILNGCEKSNPVNYNNSSQSLIPIVKGNTWYFTGTSYDTLGNVKENFGEIIDVRGDTILFGKKLTFYSGNYVTYTDSGLIAYEGYSYSLDAPGDTTVYYELLYKYPAQTGDSFSHGMKVGTIDTIVTVPAGSFHCIKYSSYYAGFLNYDVYISPGTGLIKVVSYFGANYTTNPLKISSFIELKTYNLN